MTLSLVQKSIIYSLIFIGGSISPVWADINCHSVNNVNTVKECAILLPSQELKHRAVYVKAWVPQRVKPETPVIIFFHGRGYARAPESKAPTMIEDAGLIRWITSETYQKKPAIIVSPQDLFVRADGTAKGNDYWIGAEGRNWEGFVVNELKPYVENQLHLESNKWLAAGISMGAHGAMKMSLDYPEAFKAFASISPVFRSSQNEIPPSDAPVFYKYKTLKQVSVGARLLEDEEAWQRLLTIPHWIEIHEKDFALGENFKESKQIWNRFVSSRDLKSKSSTYSINKGSFQIPGHSMDYWKSSLPRAFDWLLKYAD